MAIYFDLDLEQLAPDPELLARIPPRLAHYYLALPLAREDEQVSVVMAHPENQTALATLERLLGAGVLPLYASEQYLRAAVHRVYPDAGTVQAAVVAWGDATALDKAVCEAAYHMGRLLHLPVVDAGAETAQTPGALLVRAAPPADQLPALLAQTAAPLLLVRGPRPPLRHLLVVLRGYASDDRLLDWALPLADRGRAAVSLLALSPSPHIDLDALLCGEGPHKTHLTRCLQRLETGGVPARLVLRPGDPLDQLVAELHQQPYDLLLIAAEGEGAFVLRMLAALQTRGVHARRPVLIVKAPTPAA
jgi:hypothetical protein